MVFKANAFNVFRKVTKFTQFSFHKKFPLLNELKL